MKKLLYITAFPPNQKTGGQAFSLNAINELSQKYIIIDKQSIKHILKEINHYDQNKIFIEDIKMII